MLINKERVKLCHTLILKMIPDAFAQENGFSENLDRRALLAYTNQVPRGPEQTVVYFSMIDTPYKSNLADPHHYDKNNVEILEQMRQIKLTVDCYSKIIPIGTAKDVIRLIGSGMLSDSFEEWATENGYNVALENIEYTPDLSPLLQGNEWNERQRIIIYLNYRDNVPMNPVYMTRVPTSIEDTPNSVDAKTRLVNQ